jgi:hypothetical protein
VTLRASMSTLSRNFDLDNAPVFVMGCARSGATLLYHTLLYSGGFAVYFAEPAVFDILCIRPFLMRSSGVRQTRL